MNHPTQIENYYQKYKTEEIPIINTNDYVLMATRYKAPYHNIMKYWDKFQVSIYDKINKQILFTYNRNYSLIPQPVYVEQNNQKFIITSGSYQCISIYNITKNQFKDYVYPDDEAYEWGDGFCPTSFQWLDENLIIKGSLFDGPSQYIIIYNPNLDDLNFNKIDIEDEL